MKRKRSKSVILAMVVLFLAGVPVGGFAQYSTVNQAPQLSVGEGHFSFYWGLWRTLLPNERQIIREKGGGHLLSKRQIAWRVQACATEETIHANSETFWYFDAIQLDQAGEVRPLPEAPLKDHLYLNMVTFNSLHAKGLGPFVPPQRLPDERRRVYQKRKIEAYNQWKRRASLEGTFGMVEMKRRDKFFAGEIPDESAFFTFTSYRRGETRPGWTTPLQANRWPVYHDERAHKPHTPIKPEHWDDAPFAEHSHKARLVWNWCSPDGIFEAYIIVPLGKLPAPGPQRPGRPDKGDRGIAIIERPDFHLELEYLY